MISERKWVGRTHRRMSRIPELFLFLLGASVAFAQLPIGTISGMVRDSSGAAIPGATVEVMNRETGLTRTTQTSGNGRYALLALPAGVYEVKAEAAFFRSEIQQGLRLEVTQEAVRNFTLPVRSVQETVTVTQPPGFAGPFTWCSQRGAPTVGMPARQPWARRIPTGT